ncbi:hypothetical protein DPMN_032836 [Dreissena polymorpha]|uniref:Uncharacterized protein n=1 Tax=Dreissena polymorpha TaxID=45954 RepID=A0A9D4M7D9_DREPO|nr:hypothetical protein DPMN_032836 [Dreissena polymorpha]
MDGMYKIKKSGYIKQSADTKRDARGGVGTYLTKLGPKESRETIAKNNYDGKSWERKMDKTDVAVEVKTTATKCDAKRDVYKHEGDIPNTEIQKYHIRDDKT